MHIHTCTHAFWRCVRVCVCVMQGIPGGSDGKESACNEEDPGSIPGSGRSPGEGNGNPFQYSCPENSTDSGAWQATVHRGRKETDMTEQLTLFHVYNTQARIHSSGSNCLPVRNFLTVNLNETFILQLQEGANTLLLFTL